MSLPTYWTAPPSDARPNQIYLYRPEFYQDQDGIERRITLWFNPKARMSLSDVLGQSRSTPGTNASAGGAAATPATPAVPAAAPSHNPFRSPLDDSFHPGGASLSTSASTKVSPPSSTNAPDGLAPLPATNTVTNPK